jgi:hypothetical protein
MASTNDITMNFIHPVITPLATKLEEPTYRSIRTARTQLHDNAAGIFSSSGGGCHGHLALTMTDTEYFAITQVAFAVPINPPIDPNLVTTSRMETTENLRKHDEAKKAFKLYHDVDKALRKQLIIATPEVYLQDIKDPILGYANTTCLEIITHLRDTYGEISQEDLDANELRMGAAWNPPMPIEDLFEQLRAGAEFATEGGDAPSKPAVVRLGYNILLKTGLFTDGCRDWRKKPQADRTMATFKKHFKMWEKDRRLLLTTGAAGFFGANHLEPPAPVTPPSVPKTPLNTEMSELREQLKVIQLALAAQQAPQAPTPRRPAADTPLAELGYCWTHGYSGNLAHNSVTCVNRAAGHQQDATHANRMKGTDRIWSRADRRTPR